MTLVPGAMRTSLGRNPAASTVTVTTWGVAGLDARTAWEAAAAVPRGVVVLLGFDADLGAPVLHAGTARAASIAANTSAFFLPTLILLSIPISVVISVLILRLYSGAYSRARPLAAWRACRGLSAGCSGGR